MRSDHLRIVVSGFIVRAPLGGQVWHYLQYLVGLAELGHEVLYLEDSCFFEDDEYEWFYDPEVGKCGVDPSYGLHFLNETLTLFGLEQRWAFYQAHADCWHGPGSSWAVDFCKRADVLVNVSGVNPVRPWLQAIPRRVFVDTDPAFTQVRLLGNPINRRHGLQHNVFATFGENIPAGRADLPADVFPWIATRQPVLLDKWPDTPGPRRGPLTTVMAWETYRSEEYEGRRYGLKADSFQSFLDLPGLSSETFEMALGGSSAPRDLLQSRNWKLRDVAPRTATDYQEYIRASKAEFAVAKQGYVTSRSGWFSERSASYLASGRPVVVEDTGFPDWLPEGRGIHAFRTLEDAVAALEDLEQRYDVHCRAAREITAEYFDSRRVLPRLLDDISRAGTQVV